MSFSVIFSKYEEGKSAPLERARLETVLAEYNHEGPDADQLNVLQTGNGAKVEFTFLEDEGKRTGLAFHLFQMEVETVHLLYRFAQTLEVITRAWGKLILISEAQMEHLPEEWQVPWENPIICPSEDEFGRVVQAEFHRFPQDALKLAPIRKLPHAVGYWKSREEPKYPDPRKLPAVSRTPEEIALMVGYLRSGSNYIGWLGYSSCRFKCGVADQDLGCRDLWDGTWVWPEGLAHYVEQHHISLPEPFVLWMQSHDWKCPTPTPVELRTGYKIFDDSVWVNWFRPPKKVK